MLNFIIQSNNLDYKKRVESIINNSKDSIFKFFDSESKKLDFSIYIYDSIEDLVNGMKIRGFNDMPDYMCACYKDEDNSLNIFEPKENSQENEWNKDEYDKVIFHELIHAIQSLLFGETPEWINEGIAKYLDGTYSKGIEWLLENFINKTRIPNQIEIEEEFGMHEYDSYDYAYLMVSYIIDTKGKDYLIELLKDSNKLNVVKNNLLETAVNYYNNKYGLEPDYKSL